jgi:sulfur-carrier protein adenylyltransferase/sulfurtransferase
MSLDESERARYSRHLLLAEIGAAGQQKLKAARVLIVGAGGLGSPAALYLAAAGVGRLGIIDGDRVDVSNLQRQVLFDTADVGAPKAGRAAARLRALNPLIDVSAHDMELRAGNAAQVLADYDLVLDGSDRLGTRYLVNDACVLFGKSLVSAAIHRFEGQAMSYVPGRGPCYRCLFSDAAEGVVPNCAEAGVLGVLPGLMGALQATEAVKLITGIGEPLLGRLLTYDALAMRFSEFRFSRRDDCAVCGAHPTITALREAPAQCAPEPPADLRRYSAEELQRIVAADPAALTLVDVRELHEFAAGHLPGSLHIPLGELPQRMRELHGRFAVTFLCASGMRSQRASALAAAAGLTQVGHLEGGLRALQRPP